MFVIKCHQFGLGFQPDSSRQSCLKLSLRHVLLVVYNPMAFNEIKHNVLLFIAVNKCAIVLVPNLLKTPIISVEAKNVYNLDLTI